MIPGFGRSPGEGNGYPLQYFSSFLTVTQEPYFYCQASWEDGNRGDGERNQKASLSHGTQYIKDKVLLTLRLPSPVPSHAPSPGSQHPLPFFFSGHTSYDHSFLTRDQTGPLAVEVQSLNTGLLGKPHPSSPSFSVLSSF